MVLTSRRAPLLLLVALLVAGCGGSTALPSPTARSVVNVLEGLALRGATIRQAVAGDAGCPGVPLHGNAVRLSVTLDDAVEQHEVYLFRWRRLGQYDDAAQQFADCVEEYTDRTGAPPDVVELAPWRAYGPGWPADLRQRVEESLRAAGGR
ncbi:MAG TPA: hypothetical protein VMP67_06020 [Candidatus Limnocylindria bacterium]|nr:hypothetical protein [Candidatus Limnocylindria bacterium]